MRVPGEHDVELEMLELPGECLRYRGPTGVEVTEVTIDLAATDDI